jgi:hypothetical protein
MGNKISLEEQLIDLRITTKQMQRSAKKCEKNEKAALEKLKKVCAREQMDFQVCIYNNVLNLLSSINILF